METKEKEGYALAKGVSLYIANMIISIALLFVVVLVVRNSFGIGVDSTDESAWKRSGFTVLKDAKTGVEYLSDGHGGLVKRELK